MASLCCIHQDIGQPHPGPSHAVTWLCVLLLAINGGRCEKHRHTDGEDIPALSGDVLNFEEAVYNL